MNIDLHPEDKEITLDDGIVYVSDQYKTMSLICPCGCKNIIDLNMDPERGMTYAVNENSIEPDFMNDHCKSLVHMSAGVATFEKQTA